MKVAVIGIGSNSVRMLTAEVWQGGFLRLSRDREGTRLFAGLDEAGRLSEESMRHTAGAVARMARSAREAGAKRLHIFATSASRDAANGADFLDLLRQETGTEPEIISGEEEANLSFLGASSVLTDPEDCGVIDIGGGSTELVVGNGRAISCAFSCQMGAVRLFSQFPLACQADMEIVIREAARLLEEQLDAHPGFFVPEVWVGTGGTFTTLAAMAKRIPWTERTRMHGTYLSVRKIAVIGEELADLPLEERKKLPGLQPGRADIVVHGICILLAVMRRLGLEGIIVSEWGNLDGYLRKHYA